MLHAENVLARRYFWPGCHHMEPYRAYYPNAGLGAPAYERVAESVIVLPTGSDISKADIAGVVAILKTLAETN